MSEGTLTELDPIDALGWIDMDDGSRVRVGGTALSALRPLPEVGTRLRVLETQAGFRGVLKATRVEWAHRPPPSAAPAMAPEPPRVTWEKLVARHPRWSDLDAISVPAALDVPPLELPEHPLFAPWRDELARTAPVVVPLSVPHSSRPADIEPSPDVSFALGDVAFLDSPDWPACGLCAAPMEMCIQLSPDLVRAFGGGGAGFAALFCFACGTRAPRDPSVAWAGWTGATHRAVRPASAGHHASRPACSAQAVTARAPMRVAPSNDWYRLRSERDPDAAASVLLGFDACAVEGPFPSALSAWLDDDEWERPLHPEEVEGEFQAWMEQVPGPAPRDGSFGAYLGGVPGWDQSDDTPRCDAHGAMKLLLDHEGGQFLDGALHVFTCGACGRIRCVAEF